MTAEQLAPSVALDASGASKVFGNYTALVDAGLTVRRGTVHALLGGNGSGKSTLIKCLAGVYTADAGDVRIGETDVALADITPASARRLGLRFVHQDLGLFSQLTVAENIALGRGYPKRWGTVRERALHLDVTRLLEQFEIEARSTSTIASLRPSQRAMVAIARALDDADSTDTVLLLDEPTAALAEHDAHELMTAIRRRADSGQTVVLVSHRFGEIEAVADDVTVLRDGRIVGADRLTAMPLSRVVSLMTGGEARELPAYLVDHEPGIPQLEVMGLSTGAAADVSFTARSGEVLGFAGLDGAGHVDVLSALYGIEARTEGAVALAGESFDPKTPRQALRAGAALVPQDRHADAAFIDQSITHNLTIGVLDRIWNGVALDPSRERRVSEDAISQFGIRASSPDAPLGFLSGGNQQKVIMARWLQRTPRLILLVEPTQGVDVVARQDLYASILAAAAGGATVLLASSDVDELLTVTHRIAVFRRGRLVDVVDTPLTTRDEVTNLMMAEEPTRT